MSDPTRGPDVATLIRATGCAPSRLGLALSFLDKRGFQPIFCANGSGMLDRRWASVNTGPFAFSGRYLQTISLDLACRPAPEFVLQDIVCAVWLAGVHDVAADRVRHQVCQL